MISVTPDNVLVRMFLHGAQPLTVKIGDSLFIDLCAVLMYWTVAFVNIQVCHLYVIG